MKCETEKRVTKDFCLKIVSLRLGNVKMYILYCICYSTKKHFGF